ncbi:MAG: bifunctional precorrin-2 dehydrogenase/sirohydrochlorin ferrochelatase [Dehalococcoidia bacterium]|nr:bifunctional precorrin-2 dehydrogenase/sirohydrochlorin ferrochelatase [Dehalococcoidia bacterium]
MNRISPYYPLFLNLQDRKCVVVGGGEVAERKVTSLIDHGASVTVISSSLSPGLAKLAAEGKIQVRSRDYRDGDLSGAILAIAATDDSSVNKNVACEGHECGVLTNVVDSPDDCQFIVPAIVRRGDITVAISTGGTSPALARKLRTKLEEFLGPGYSSLAALVSEVRKELKDRNIDVPADRWQDMLDINLLLNMLRTGDFESARQRLLSDLIQYREGKSAK